MMAIAEESPGHAAPNRSPRTVSTPYRYPVGGGLRAFMLALACLAIPCAPALAADALIIQNVSARTVLAVHVAPVGMTGWGPNRLGSALPDSEHAVIDLGVFGSDICLFDVLVEDDEGDSSEWTNVDLCDDPYLSY